MFRCKILLVFTLYVAVLAHDVAVPPEPSQNPESSTETTNTTSKIPTTATTPKTSTVTTPSTTTIPPNITTTSTTTPKPKTTTTTIKPTTAAPSVNPDVLTWTANYTDSNHPCLIVQMAAQFELLEENSNKTLKINIPKESSGKGSCKDSEDSNESLEITWGINNTLVLKMHKTNASKYEIEEIQGTLNVSSGSGYKLITVIHQEPEFLTPLKNSYKCSKEQTLNLTSDNTNETLAYLHLSQVHYQAFYNGSNTDFASAVDCEPANLPDVVPVVVGCVLAALVVLILVAYLFGRRRCQARGYLSMFAEDKCEEDYIPMKNLSCFN